MARKTKLQKQAEQLAEDEKKKQRTIVESELCVESIFCSAFTIHTMCGKDTDFVILTKQLKQKIDKVNAGDIQGVECMLAAQAHTLDVVFNKMMIQARSASFIPQLQAYSEIALKAQNQCRQTLAVLAELKNPKRTMFVKQQNLAINQQVNNNAKPENSKKVEKTANELLIEAKEHETLDIGGTVETIPANPKLETVATGWSKDARGQSNQQDERL